MRRFLKTNLVLSSSIFCLLLSTVAFADELAGIWTLTLDTPRGVRHPSLEINQDGDGYSGVYNSLRGPIDIETISREGDSFTFPLVITVPIGEIKVNYAGTISGDNMTGTVQGARGEVPFTATRGAP